MDPRTKVVIIVPEESSGLETFNDSFADHICSAFIAHVLKLTRSVDEITILACKDVLETLRNAIPKHFVVQFRNTFFFKPLDLSLVNQKETPPCKNFKEVVIDYLSHVGEGGIDNLFVFILDHGDDSRSIGKTNSIIYNELVSAACSSNPKNVIFFCDTFQSGVLVDSINIDAIARTGLEVYQIKQIKQIIEDNKLDPIFPLQYLKLIKSINLQHFLKFDRGAPNNVFDSISNLFGNGEYLTLDSLITSFDIENIRQKMHSSKVFDKDIWEILPNNSDRSSKQAKYISSISENIKTINEFTFAIDLLNTLEVSDLKSVQSLPYLISFFKNHAEEDAVKHIKKLASVKNVFPPHLEGKIENLPCELLEILSTTNISVFDTVDEFKIPREVNVAVFCNPRSSSNLFYLPIRCAENFKCFGNIISVEFVAALLTSSPNETVSDLFTRIIDQVGSLSRDLHDHNIEEKGGILPEYASNDKSILSMRLDQLFTLKDDVLASDPVTNGTNAFDIINSFSERISSKGEFEELVIKHMKALGFERVRIPVNAFGSSCIHSDLAENDRNKIDKEYSMPIGGNVNKSERNYVIGIESSSDEEEEECTEKEYGFSSYNINDPVRVKISKMSREEFLEEYYNEGKDIVLLYYEILNNVLLKMGAREKFAPFNCISLEYFEEPNLNRFEDALEPLSGRSIPGFKYFTKTRFSLAKYLSTQFQKGHDYYDSIKFAWNVYHSTYKEYYDNGTIKVRKL